MTEKSVPERLAALEVKMNFIAGISIASFSSALALLITVLSGHPL